MAFSKIASGGVDGGVGDSLRPNAQPLFRNSDMAIAQRSTSVASLSSTSSYQTVDGFFTWLDNAGTWTMSQDTDVPANTGIKKSVKWDCTTATGTLNAGGYLIMEQRIEAQDLQYAKYGTANAEVLTLSFWIKATKTGTNIIEVYQPDADRYVSASYTVSSSNTWEKKTVLIPADTGGTINNDNGDGLRVGWWFVAGSNYTSGTLATSWTSVTAANRTVGQVNNGDSTSNNINLTGIQLEYGSYTADTIPPYQIESYGNNLSRCHRYFEHRGYTAANQQVFTGQTISSTKCTGPLFYAVKRSAPTITMGNAICNNQHNGVGGTVTTKSTAQIGLDTARFDVTHNASNAGFAITQGFGLVQLDNTTMEGIQFNSEL